MSFDLLTDEQEAELIRLSGFYRNEAKRCQHAKAYLAGCVMIGSVLETALILMVNVYPDEAEYTGKVPKRNNMPKPLLDWHFIDLLRVAKAAGWLPYSLDLTDDWNHKKAKVGDFAEVVRMVRNLIHPARYVEDHHGKRVTENYLRRQFETVFSCCDSLQERNSRPD